MTNEGTNLMKSFYLHGTEKQNCVEILILSPGSPTTTLFDRFSMCCTKVHAFSTSCSNAAIGGVSDHIKRANLYRECISL